jgi:hypothetical protein
VEALWFVFGLLILVPVWMVLRRLGARLPGRSIWAGALVGALVGVATSIALAILGIAVVWLGGLPGLDTTPSEVLRAGGTFMFIIGFLFAPVAAAYGALQLAVDRWRNAPVSDGERAQ